MLITGCSIAGYVTVTGIGRSVFFQRITSSTGSQPQVLLDGEYYLMLQLRSAKIIAIRAVPLYIGDKACVRL